ncbi:MAG: PAS domain S-box protein, partial [Actinobacteria bacterium]|nr:PAS domain S-box protein [Actinomycetota bacterium]
MEPLPSHARHDLLVDDRLSRLLEASVDAIMVMDAAAQVLWVSPATEVLLQRSLGELRSIDPLELVHAEDLPEAARLLGRMYEGVDDDDPAVVRLLTGDGRAVWVEVKGKDLSDVPGVGGMVLTARDISYRLDLEAALRSTQQRFE